MESPSIFGVDFLSFFDKEILGKLTIPHLWNSKSPIDWPYRDVVWFKWDNTFESICVSFVYGIVI